MTEIERKLERVRQLLKREGLRALRLRGVSWFAWATGGGDSSVSLSSELGNAEVLITDEKSYVLATTVDLERLQIEEVPREFEIVSFPWAQEDACDDFVAARIGGRKGVVADRPRPGEGSLGEDWLALRRRLSQKEISRYHELGSEVARGVTKVLCSASPEQSERAIAAALAAELVLRGIQPLVIQVGGFSRIGRYRRPLPTDTAIGDRALLTVCGRRHGLHASLTRLVYFRPVTATERARFNEVREVEDEALRATEELRPLPDIYRRMRQRYVAHGHGDEIEKDIQGGATGYRLYEALARPQGTAGFHVEESMAFSRSPSFSGVKVQDTVVIGNDRRLILLTEDPSWPGQTVGGLMRPDVLVRS